MKWKISQNGQRKKNRLKRGRRWKNGEKFRTKRTENFEKGELGNRRKRAENDEKIKVNRQKKKRKGNQSGKGMKNKWWEIEKKTNNYGKLKKYQEKWLKLAEKTTKKGKKWYNRIKTTGKLTKNWGKTGRNSGKMKNKWRRKSEKINLGKITTRKLQKNGHKRTKISQWRTIVQNVEDTKKKIGKKNLKKNKPTKTGKKFTKKWQEPLKK